MKSKFLFSKYFQLLGWILAIPGFVLGYLVVFRSFEINGFGLKLRDDGTLFTSAFENFTNELALTLVIIGLLFIAFAKLKHEDELTASLRLNALYWAILINYVWYAAFVVFVLLNLIFHAPWLSEGLSLDVNSDFPFMLYNLFMPLVIFIGRFNYLLFKNKTEYQVKPLHFLPYKPYNIMGKALTIICLTMSFIGFVIMNAYDIVAIVCFLSPFIMMLWVYSKEKQEDEYINHIRLDAMQIAVYGNYIILLLSNWFVFDGSFLLLMVINLTSIPLIFISVFNYRLWKLKRQPRNAGGNNLNLNIL